MYLSELQLTNFRQFGATPVTVEFNAGVTALIGSNDSGKTAVIDAIRYVLTTRDQDYLRVQPEDFNYPSSGEQASSIVLRCKLSGLSLQNQGAFVEYLTYEESVPHLYLYWTARRTGEAALSRRWVNVSLSSGPEGLGQGIDVNARQLLATAYLRPLRDAEREMSSGKGSRLSQVLSMFPAIKNGTDFDRNTPPTTTTEVDELGLAGLSEYLRHLVNAHSGVTSARDSINTDYLSALSLTGDDIRADINFVSGRDENGRLRQILERLELNLLDGGTGSPLGNYGLGSNNLLFMACELLLMSKEEEGLPLLLIEEPEAHLHPQRQLRLMQFLQSATQPDAESPVQVIVTTHSPNLASKIPLESLVIIKEKQPFSLRSGQTKLNRSDSRFLERFLDATKANLFFARGVLIVEGDAEELLLPTIASLLNRDFTQAGVSIVNVRGTGLRRYSQIFQRSDPSFGTLQLPVALMTDIDVMPERAPEVLGIVSGPDDKKWTSPKRRWKSRQQFSPEQLDELQKKLKAHDGQGVRTFVADDWTFEYALAAAGLPRAVHHAAILAQNDDAISDQTKTRKDVNEFATTSYDKLVKDCGDDKELIAIHIYGMYRSGKASKAIAAQYLAEILLRRSSLVDDYAEKLRRQLPKYLTDAIDYVTGSPARVN